MLHHPYVALFTIQNEFRYEIVRKLYEGGMGIVYEAEQLGARGFIKRVAIKVIRQNYADQKQFIDNFIGEAKLVADLIHTNIVQTYHLGVWFNSPTDAHNAGCAATITPFNGEHNAGIQVLNTASFPADQGPLRQQHN